jgi:hypothetical protein
MQHFNKVKAYLTLGEAEGIRCGKILIRKRNEIRSEHKNIDVYAVCDVNTLICIREIRVIPGEINIEDKKDE